ncbi:MAG: DegT/DnrJ/EryC1/StrS family aminotransferase [Spirochaetes bacterium]|nr:DegT/DnrJ/EryC1/StrS family aminotransferase [Spirochaetota bacterium]
MIKYPLAKETITNSEIDKLIEWLKKYPKLTMGEVTKQFEKEWAKWIGTEYAVFCNSGSSANLLMLYALLVFGKIKRGQKVIVPAVGWGTTIAPIIQLGLEPIMVDVLKSTYELDPSFIDDYDNVCAVMLVHSLGIPAHAEYLRNKCEERGIYLLEDACAALGSEYDNGRKVGTHGIMSSFSFYFGHQLSTIEGGMVNTNDKEIYETLLMARSHGWLKDISENKKTQLMQDYNIDSFHSPFTFFIPGFNLRSTDLQAYLGLLQMEKADWVVERRDRNHRRYRDNFSGTEIISQTYYPNEKICSISFGTRCLSKEKRTKIVAALVENNIETRLFSAGNLGRHPFWYNHNGKLSAFPVADLIHNCGFFLPNYPELELDEIDFISNIVLEAVT